MLTQYMTSTVSGILETVSQTRDWDMLRLAADALEDAGADPETVESFRDGSCDWKLETAVQQFVKLADAISEKQWADNEYTFSKPPKHRADYISDKWIRVVTMEERNGKYESTSVHTFIARVDNRTKTLGSVRRGDIHKSASFKVPARHARGSVFSTNVSDSLTSYGAVYLR